MGTIGGIVLEETIGGIALEETIGGIVLEEIIVGAETIIVDTARKLLIQLAHARGIPIRETAVTMEDALGVISVMAMNVHEKIHFLEEALHCAGAVRNPIASVPQIASGQEVLKALGPVSLNGAKW